MMSHLLEQCPYAVQRIAFFLSSTTPVGPPKDFVTLNLLCRSTRRALSTDADQTYLDVFSHKFDVAAPLIKVGRSIIKRNASRELQRRFTLLKLIRRRDFQSPQLTEALWLAYLMFEDSDRSQKNFRQLHWAGLPSFLDTFIRLHLDDGAEANHGWPVPNEKNSLAVALFWMTSSHLSLGREQEQIRISILLKLAPIVFAAFRYPIFNRTESQFNLDNYTYERTSDSPHGPYPPAPFEHEELPYFGEITQTTRVPLLSVFASLSFFARKEVVPPSVPPHLLATRRLTREDADARGETGPTVEDVNYFINECHTRFADVPIVDLRSLAISGSPSHPLPYKLGSLTASWQGSYMMPFLGDYDKWLADVNAPTDLSSTGRLPLFMTLQEHYICESLKIAPSTGIADGTVNAWLPFDCRLNSVEGGIEVTDEKGTFKTFYRTFHHGTKPAPVPHEVMDVIITGKTDACHAAAWGNYNIIGRVRMADGLIVLARNLTEDPSIRMLLRGYVTSSQNLVGRMKGASSGTHPAGWEAAFSLCKKQMSQR